MLNKNTVVFITDKKRTDVADLIKKEFNSDNSYLFLNVSESKLESKAKLRISRNLGNKTARIRDTIIGFFEKINVKNRDGQERKIMENAKDKRTLNLIYRYSPSLIITNSPTALPYVINAVNKSGLKINVAVCNDEYTIDDKLIRQEVRIYYVDNISVRNYLLRNGINADRIEVNPLPVGEEFFTEVNMEEKKTELGFSPDRKLIVIDASEEDDNAFKPIIDAIATFNGECDFALMCGKNRKIYNYASNKKIATFNETTSDFALYASADAIVMRPQTESLKCASALKKPVLSMYPLGKRERENANYLLADGRIKEAKNADEFLHFVSQVEDDRTTPSSDALDRHSAEKIAESIKQITIIS